MQASIFFGIKTYGSSNQKGWDSTRDLDDIQLIARPKDDQLCYMVLTPPLVGSLDYTIRVHEESVKNSDGTMSYHSRWELANTDGPPPRRGITRVTVNEGSWLLEPIGNQTRATYTLYTDGGGIPPLLMNFANKLSVSRLFDALRGRMRDGKSR
jgi:hypothetical protein